MKREILFRGQDKIGYWHCGYLHIDTIMAEDKYYINSSCCVDNPNFIEVKPETVGQLTDSLDVDGNEIYEGDLVNQRAVLIGDDENIDFTGHVVFREGCWVIDNGNDCIPLWSEHRENRIIE